MLYNDVSVSKNNDGTDGFVVVKIEKNDDGSELKVSNNDDDDNENDHKFLKQDVGGFMFSQDTESALKSAFVDKHPKHCSHCGSLEHNIVLCVSLYTNDRAVCQARLLVPGNYHVYYAPHRYSHNQSSFPVEMYAQQILGLRRMTDYFPRLKTSMNRKMSHQVDKRKQLWIQKWRRALLEILRITTN
jgi:hypothetical protein